jgi:hypothetical protein
VPARTRVRERKAALLGGLDSLVCVPGARLIVLSGGLVPAHETLTGSPCPLWVSRSCVCCRLRSYLADCEEQQTDRRLEDQPCADCRQAGATQSTAPPHSQRGRRRPYRERLGDAQSRGAPSSWLGWCSRGSRPVLLGLRIQPPLKEGDSRRGHVAHRPLHRLGLAPVTRQTRGLCAR